MTIVLSPQSLDLSPSYEPSGASFLNLFSSCTMYLLTWRLVKCRTCQQETTTTAVFYSRNMTAPVVVESLLQSMGSGYGPKFQNGHHQQKSQLLRFTAGCRAQIYLPTVLLLQSQLGQLNNVKKLIRLSNERPNYFILYFQLRTDPRNLASFLRAFKDMTIPSKFIFLWNSNSMSLMCISCPHAPSPASRTFHDIRGLSRGEIDELHRRVHGHLHGAAVYHDTVEIDWERRSCSRYGGILDVQAVSCSFDMIITNINASTVISDNMLTAPKLPYVGVIYSMQYASRVEFSGEWGRGRLYEWMPVAETAWEFTFVNIVQPLDFGVAMIAIANASLETYLAFLGTGLAMVVVMTCLMGSSADRSVKWWNTLGSVSTFAILQLLEKHYFPPLPRKRVLLMLALFLWAQVAAFVSSELKGYLVSSFASTRIPEVPKDFVDLAETNSVMFTVAGMRINSSKRTRTSLLRRSMEDLVTLESFANSPTSRRLQALGGKLRFTGLSEHFLARLAAEEIPQRPIQVVTGWMNSTVRRNVSIPPNIHIFIDTKVNTLTYAAAYRVFSGYTKKKRRTLVIPGTDLSVLTQRMPFLVLMNGFLEVFRPKLYQVYESGLWFYWNEMEEANRVFQTVKLAAEMVDEDRGGESKQNSCHFRAAMNGEFDPYVDEELVTPISVDFMVTPIKIFLFCSASCLAVFLAEVAVWNIVRTLHQQMINLVEALFLA